MQKRNSLQLKAELKTKIKEELKNEFKKLGLVLIAMYLFLQVWYHKENPFVVARLVLAHAYLFIIPGFSLLLYLKDEISFTSRFLIGIALGYSASLLLTIYINLAVRTNISSYYWISPILLTILGVYLFIKQNKQN